MDPNLITPFVSSIQNVFSTMLQLEVTIGDPSIHNSAKPSHDVSGIIGMSGDVTGSVVLSFAGDAAQGIVALFCGESIELESPDFADAVGELVNMVSGGAKALFPTGKAVSISVPSVIVGKDHTVTRPSGIPTVAIPCTCDCGEFVIEVTIREAPAAAAAADGQETATA